MATRRSRAPLPGRLVAGLLAAWLGLLMVQLLPVLRGAPSPVSNPPFVVGEPFSAAALVAVAGRFAAGHASVLAWIAGVLALGGFLDAWIGGAGRPSPARVLVRLGLGVAAAAPVALGLGLAGLWFPQVFWVVTAGSVVVARRSLAGLAALPVQPWRRLGRWLARAGVVERVLLAVAGAAAAMAFTGTLGPETYYDPSYYLLACPERYVDEHKVIRLAWHGYAALPAGMSVLYGWQRLLGGEPAVRAWRPWLLLALLVAAWRLVRATAGRPAAAAATAATATMPLLFFNALRTKEDVEAALLALVALLVMEPRGAGVAGPRGLARGALLAGQALAVKLTAVLWAPWFLVLAVLRRPIRDAGGRATLAAACVAACLAPWWARNVLDHGNPVHPFAGRASSSTAAALKIRMGQNLAERARPGQGEASVTSWSVLRGMVGETGPGVATALAAVVLLPFAAGGVPSWTWIAALSAMSWASLTHLPRFGLVPWLMFCVLGASAAWRATARSPGGRVLFAAVALAVALANLGPALRGWRDEFGGTLMLRGRLPGSSLIRQRMRNGPWELLDRGARWPASGGRVLVVGDFRGLHWPVPVVHQGMYDENVLDAIIGASADARRAAIRIRHIAPRIYLNDAEIERLKFAYQYPILMFDARGQAVVRDLWRRWLDEVVRTGPAGLYRVRRAPRWRGAAPRLPLSLDESAYRAAMHLTPTVTWE